MSPRKADDFLVPLFTMISPDKIIRSSRSTIAVQINSENKVIVRAPSDMPESEIMEFVMKCQSWLEKKLTERQNRQIRVPMTGLDEGSKILYLGKEYVVNYADVAIPTLSGNTLQIPLSAKEQNLIEGWAVWWFKIQAELYFADRVAIFAQRMGETYKAVKLSPAHSRWGSCSSLRNLNFSWRLIFCPPDIIDYVIVHELSHLKHMNHSTAFWNRVQYYYPMFETCKLWLKNNTHLLRMYPKY